MQGILGIETKQYGKDLTPKLISQILLVFEAIKELKYYIITNGRDFKFYIKDDNKEACEISELSYSVKSELLGLVDVDVIMKSYRFISRANLSSRDFDKKIEKLKKNIVISNR